MIGSFPQPASLRKLLREHSVVLGSFTLASGKRSSYYIDVRKTTMSGEGQEVVGWLGYHLLHSLPYRVTHVGGLTLGADPIAYAIAHRTRLEGGVLDAFTVRKKAKDHGTANLIEGPVNPGASCLVVEDCLTTGGSTLQAVRALRKFGCRVDDALTVVDRSSGKGTQALLQEGVRLHSFVLAEELAKEAPP